MPVLMFIYTYVAANKYGRISCGGGVVFHKSAEHVREQVLSELTPKFPAPEYSLDIYIAENGISKDAVVEYFDRNELLLIDYY